MRAARSLEPQGRKEAAGQRSVSRSNRLPRPSDGQRAKPLGLAACQRAANSRKTTPLSAAEHVLGKESLLARIAGGLPLATLCSLQAASQSARRACNSDFLWENLVRRYFARGSPQAAGAAGRTDAKPPQRSSSSRHDVSTRGARGQPPVARAVSAVRRSSSGSCGQEPSMLSKTAATWKEEFFRRLRARHATFRDKTLPQFIRKTIHRGSTSWPDLCKIVDELRLRFSITLDQRQGAPTTKRLSEDSFKVSQMSTCISCSFSALKLKVPFRLALMAHSIALGQDVEVASVELKDKRAWGNPWCQEDHVSFYRSPCGRWLLGFWQEDTTLAGFLCTVHHQQILHAFLSEDSWQELCGRPPPDDIDSRLGLHDYIFDVRLHGSRAEIFQHAFMQVDAKDTTSICPPQDWWVDQTTSASRTSISRQQDLQVAHFPVLRPHASGSAINHPCTKPLQLAFNTPAYKMLLDGVVFVDITVFDEHRKVFWALSAVAKAHNEEPPAACMSVVPSIDFDRPTTQVADTRWLCIGDRQASLVTIHLQREAELGKMHFTEEQHLEFGGRRQGDQLSGYRVNAISWHVLLPYLNAWWGSHHTA